MRIDFELEYTERKTLGISVHPDTSVKVKAPIESSISKIKEKVRDKASWIVKQQSYFMHFDAILLEYEVKSGYSVYYFGRQYKFAIEQGNKNEVFYKNNSFQVIVKNKQKAQEVFNQWLIERAKSKILEVATPIIKEFSKYHDVPDTIYFMDMPKRWGSCTVKNKLIFNPKLIHVPKRCIEYVVMHELCHLMHKNHNTAFFNLLTTVMPDWKGRKEKLDKFK